MNALVTAFIVLISFMVFSIAIGFFWVWIYRERNSLGLPDWLSGILAQGIISGHKVNASKAKPTDYTFVVVATLFSVILCLTLIIILYAIFSRM